MGVVGISEAKSTHKGERLDTLDYGDEDIKLYSFYTGIGLDTQFQVPRHDGNVRFSKKCVRPNTLKGPFRHGTVNKNVLFFADNIFHNHDDRGTPLEEIEKYHAVEN